MLAYACPASFPSQLSAACSMTSFYDLTPWWMVVNANQICPVIYWQLHD